MRYGGNVYVIEVPTVSPLRSDVSESDDGTSTEFILDVQHVPMEVTKDSKSVVTKMRTEKRAPHREPPRNRRMDNKNTRRLIPLTLGANYGNRCVFVKVNLILSLTDDRIKTG